eukprot:CAMPEP_0202691684 /NCGR_PEP_ID=MMETSP1385-20130828/6336_1 /ASSEMBLY_ACC=CAM_ASM_000861 /TAXON_ID=933848 /ORGANISM="Elphidium margaritaceum" /LENGTH=501 /DNA_ID=CAMNT_0049347127 /DNA_START=24 /DNA_END=1526 /DNA_ORIENTATION=+
MARILSRLSSFALRATIGAGATCLSFSKARIARLDTDVDAGNDWDRMFGQADGDPEASFSHFLDDDVLSKQTRPSVAILVLDGGGLRGCMAIQVLKALEREIQQVSGDQDLKLHECFDFISGTSTGGLIALGLGKKHWSAQRIDDFYDRVATEVFNKDASFGRRWWNKIKSAGSALGINTALDSDKLEEIFKSEFGDANMTGTQAGNNSPARKAVDEPFLTVVASLSNYYKLAWPALLRNYDVSSRGYIEFTPHEHYHLPGLSDCKIWEAARATSAAPTYFDKITIEMPPRMKDALMKRLIAVLMFGNAVRALSKKQRATADEIFKSVKSLSGDSDAELSNIVERINMERNRCNISGSISKQDLKEQVLDFDYSLDFRDGGMSSNAPVLFAYSEAKRMFPGCDVKILAVGTGRPPQRKVYNKVKEPIFLAQVFDEIFGAKEHVTLAPLISLAYSDDAIDLERLNPEIDADKDSMANAALMPYWRETGTKMAKDNERSISAW